MWREWTGALRRKAASACSFQQGRQGVEHRERNAGRGCRRGHGAGRQPREPERRAPQGPGDRPGEAARPPDTPPAPLWAPSLPDAAGPQPQLGRAETDSAGGDATLRPPLQKPSYLAVNRRLRILSSPSVTPEGNAATGAAYAPETGRGPAIPSQPKSRASSRPGGPPRGKVHQSECRPGRRSPSGPIRGWEGGPRAPVRSSGLNLRVCRLTAASARGLAVRLRELRSANRSLRSRATRAAESVRRAGSAGPVSGRRLGGGGTGPRGQAALLRRGRVLSSTELEFPSPGCLSPLERRPSLGIAGEPGFLLPKARLSGAVPWARPSPPRSQCAPTARGAPRSRATACLDRRVAARRGGRGRGRGDPSQRGRRLPRRPRAAETVTTPWADGADSRLCCCCKGGSVLTL